MRKKIMTLMMGALLLLTACGQTGSNSASTMLPVAAVQSAAQAIAPMEDKTQEDVDSLPAEEGVEEVKGADDKETPNPAEDTDTPSAKTEETSITDGSLTLDNSAYRFPASVSVDASQEVLEAKARDMVDYTFRQLMMQAGVDTLADAGFRCNVCIVEDGASLLIYVLYAG